MFSASPEHVATQRRIDQNPVLRDIFQNLCAIPSRGHAQGITVMIGNLLDRIELLESRLPTGEYPGRRRIVPTP